MTPTNEAGYGLPELPEPDPDMQGKEYSAGCYERGYTADQMRQYARAALALSRGVPEGWKLVPVEPTEAMCGAIEYGAARPICETHQADRMYFLRKAIAAAPAAAGAQGEGSGQERDWSGRIDDAWRDVMSSNNLDPLDDNIWPITAALAYAQQAWRRGPLPPHTPQPAAASKCSCPSGDGSLRWPCPVHQPAAADGGVREMAREILADAQQMADGHGVNARLILDEGMSLRCNVACDVALRAVSAALSSHRQAGGGQDG